MKPRDIPDIEEIVQRSAHNIGLEYFDKRRLNDLPPEAWNDPVAWDATQAAIQKAGGSAVSDQLNTSPEMCIYWHDQAIKANHKAAELEARVAELEALVPRWISAATPPPTDAGEISVICAYKDKSGAWYQQPALWCKDDSGQWFYWADYGDEVEGCDYWMLSLPAPQEDA